MDLGIIIWLSEGLETQDVESEEAGEGVAKGGGLQQPGTCHYCCRGPLQWGPNNLCDHSVILAITWAAQLGLRAAKLRHVIETIATVSSRCFDRSGCFKFFNWWEGPHNYSVWNKEFFGKKQLANLGQRVHRD